MRTSELFEKEINLIKNEHLRNIVARTLDASPECIQTIPASATGKYHPEYSLGEGGLVRHIKSAVGIAYSMIESDVLEGYMCGEDDSYSKSYADIVYASLVLHDCCKPDDTPNHNTRFDHPLIGAELFGKIAMDYINENNLSYRDRVDIENIIIVIFRCIRTHMGKYTTSKYAPDICLPRPYTNLEWFVHSCDLLSSKKYIGFDFDKYYEVLK